MTERKEWTFGTHKAQLEDPDVLVIRFSGPVTLEDAKAAIELHREIGSKTPFFLLADISASSLGAEARKYMADNALPAWYRGVVYVGANFLLRTISKSLTLMVLFNGSTNYELSFVATELEGRSLITRWRATSAFGPAKAG